MCRTPRWPLAALLTLLAALAAPAGLRGEEEYNNAMGNYYSDLDQPHTAIFWYKEAIKAQDGDSVPMGNIARCYVDLQDYPMALRWVEWALKTNDYKHATDGALVAQTRDVRLRASVRYALKQYDKSARDWALVVQREPNNGVARQGFGEALYMCRRYGECLTTFQKAAELGYGDNANYCSMSWAELGYYERAFAVADQADQSYGRVCALLALGRGDLVGKEADLLVRRNGDGARYFAVYGCLGYRQAGRLVQARELAERAAAASSSRAWPYPLLDYLRGRLSAQELSEAAAGNDQKTEAQAVLGLCFCLEGKREQGLKHLEWVVKYGRRDYIELHLASIEYSRKALSRHVEPVAVAAR